MSEIRESNVDELKTEHECDEHWELRRKFLLTHADKFPKEELMCLAQVFTNVEFLGCKYPKETMRMISELSKEVVQDYREKQKGRLQRTFVGASDAASSKAKGQSRQDKPSLNPRPSSSNQSSPHNYPSLSTSFKRKSDPTPQESSSQSSPHNYPSLSTSFKRKSDPTPQERYSDPKRIKPNSKRKTDVVLMEYINDNPQSIVIRAANSYDIELDWKFDNAENSMTVCYLYFNGHKVAEGTAINQKEAKKEASAAALKEMQKIYYTVKVTKNLTPTVNESFKSEENPKPNSDAIGSDNIGSKMMKLMGWSGGGLGKSSQGITEPVNVQQQMTREGIGLKPGMYNMQVFKKKCQEVLRNYISTGDTSVDLVFSPCFTNEERGLIHQLAKQLGLKSQSYGPKSQRTLTISRKINPQDLVNELLELGGSTDKYQLIEPTED